MSKQIFKRISIYISALLISLSAYADLQNVEVRGGAYAEPYWDKHYRITGKDSLSFTPKLSGMNNYYYSSDNVEIPNRERALSRDIPIRTETERGYSLRLQLADLQNLEVGSVIKNRGESNWKHPLQNWAKLESPLVEVTPFVFKEKLYLMESWQKQWENPKDEDGSHFTKDEVRIRDMAADRIVSTPLIGHGLAMTFIHEGTAYVFAGNWGTEKKWNITEIVMTSSTDLKNWTKPEVVLKAQPDEKFFNVSVCKGRDSFVLLVESNEPKWPAFTFKYFTSVNLTDWTRVPDALYGVDKYVGGPALYFEGDWYYTLYLQSLGKGHYETRVARSKDLINWIDADVKRPFVTFQTENKVHPLRPAELREKNASDAEICYWNGKTIVYYTGGEQHYAGDLQYADFPGTPQELLEYYFK